MPMCKDFNTIPAPSLIVDTVFRKRERLPKKQTQPSHY
jgi:hypothetical protein